MEGGLGPQYSSSAILEGIERLGLGLACRTPRLRIFCRQVNNTSKPSESHSYTLPDYEATKGDVGTERRHNIYGDSIEKDKVSGGKGLMPKI